MLNNDALFSYIAPRNIFAWALTPLRFCIGLRHYVWLNRTVIKLTHFPLLLCIFLYEKVFLASSMYELTDLVENPTRGRQRSISFADNGRGYLLSPNHLREESVVTYQKSRALDELFRRPPDTTMRTQRRHERRKTQSAIRSWVDQQNDSFASPGHHSTIDSRMRHEWQSHPGMDRDKASPAANRRAFRQVSAEVRSTASDPADLVSNAGGHATRYGTDLARDGISRVDHQKDTTDVEAELGDDELGTNDEDEEDS